jgi:hypothetical protein
MNSTHEKVSSNQKERESQNMRRSSSEVRSMLDKLMDLLEDHEETTAMPRQLEKLHME